MLRARSLSSPLSVLAATPLRSPHRPVSARVLLFRCKLFMSARCSVLSRNILLLRGPLLPNFQHLGRRSYRSHPTTRHHHPPSPQSTPYRGLRALRTPGSSSTFVSGRNRAVLAVCRPWPGNAQLYHTHLLLHSFPCNLPPAFGLSAACSPGNPLVWCCDPNCICGCSSPCYCLQHVHDGSARPTCIYVMVACRAWGTMQGTSCAHGFDRVDANPSRC